MTALAVMLHTSSYQDKPEMNPSILDAAPHTPKPTVLSRMDSPLRDALV